MSNLTGNNTLHSLITMALLHQSFAVYGYPRSVCPSVMKTESCSVWSYPKTINLYYAQAAWKPAIYSLVVRTFDLYMTTDLEGRGTAVSPKTITSHCDSHYSYVAVSYFGAGDGIWTHDNLLGRQELYHWATPAIITGSYFCYIRAIVCWTDPSMCLAHTQVFWAI